MAGEARSGGSPRGGDGPLGRGVRAAGRPPRRHHPRVLEERRPVCPAWGALVSSAACSWSPRTPLCLRATSWRFVGSSPGRGSLPTPIAGCAGARSPRSPIREEHSPVTAGEHSKTHQDPAKRVIIFDTTLRDGEQSPGATMNTSRRSSRSAASSRAWAWTSSRRASRSPRPATSRPSARSPSEVTGAIVCGLAARERRRTSTRGWRGGQAAERARASTPSSPPADCTCKYKLQLERGGGARRSSTASRWRAAYVRGRGVLARGRLAHGAAIFCSEVHRGAIEAGATTINIPDTVGYAVPGRVRRPHRT